MAVVDIYTSLVDTQIGNTTPSDGIGMIAAPGVAVASSGSVPGFALNTAYMLTSVTDLTSMGVTQTNNPDLMFQVQEYYAKAGSGSRVWVVAYTAATYSTFISLQLESIISGTTASNFDLRPRILAFAFPASIYASATAGNNMTVPAVKSSVEQLFIVLQNLFNQSIRMAGIADCGALLCTGAGGIVSEDLATKAEDLSTWKYNRVSFQIVTSTPGKPASVGRTLGMLAVLPISTSLGAVATAGAAASVDYFMDYNVASKTFVNTPVSRLTPTKCNILGSKQYLFTRTRPQESGVFYNDGATCNNRTMALSELSFVRVGNAVCDSVEKFFVRLLQENIPTDLSTGAIASGFKASTLAQLDNMYLAPRISRGEAQQIIVDFNAKDGNYNMSKAIEVSVRIVPLAPLREVFIETLFVTTVN